MGQKTITISAVPTSLQEFCALPEAAMKDPYDTAALAVLALSFYPKEVRDRFRRMISSS